MIENEHFIDMKELNDFIVGLKKQYETEIKIINISSTEGGYDLFYIIRS